MGIVWLDAHSDVQTLETTASGYLGGLPLRLLIGYRPGLIAARLGLRPVAEQRVLLAGARDLGRVPPTKLKMMAARRWAQRCHNRPGSHRWSLWPARICLSHDPSGRSGPP